jgi:peptide/nickel transport system permease protein
VTLLLRIASRVLWTVPVALGVVTVTFFIARVVAGNPAALLLPPGASQAVRNQFAARLGLNKPLLDQYWIYLKALVHGNLGTSITTNRSVASDLWQRFPATAELALISLVIAIVGGVAIGVLAARYKDRWPDYVVRVFSLTGLSLSQFWFGLLLIWLFFVKWHILPGPDGRLPIGVNAPPKVTGFYLIDSLLAGQLHVFWESLRQLILPVITLSFVALAPVARVTRTAMVEAMQSDFIRTAVAMGHGPRKVYYYALRNALLPVVTLIGGIVGFLLSGAILIEVVYDWPGIGQYALQSIQGADFPAIQGFVIYAAVLVVLAYLVVDVLYYVIDPRTRT